MLKTNSKKARENIRAYVLNGFCGENYNIPQPETFAEAAKHIMCIFREERPAKYYPRMSEAQNFSDWCAGLPSILDTCYYYNRSAVDDLGAILEETEEEKAKYTEEKAESLLTAIIYRELLKGVQTK